MPLIPAWSIAPWTAVLLAVVALHLWHARSVTGSARWWHLAHVAMGAGMITMFLVSHHDSAALYWALVVAFAGHAVVMAIQVRRIVGLHRWVWFASIVDQLLMVYMLIPLGERPAALTMVAVAYLVVAACTWLVVPGRLLISMTPPVDMTPPLYMTPPRAVASPDAYRAAKATAVAAAPTPRRAARTITAGHVSADLTVGVRLTLAVMAVAMAWMLLAMQNMGAAATHDTHHMGSMTMSAPQ